MDVEIRAASADDAPAVGRLLVVLYDHEAPGVLGGERGRLAELFADVTAARPVRNHWLAVDVSGNAVGLAALATREEPRTLPAIPPLLAGLRRLGAAGAARTAAGALRGALTLAPPAAPHEVLLHTIVVDPSWWGRGLGGRLVAVLEDEGRRRSKTSAVLQVVESNGRAIALYERLGYELRERVCDRGWRRRIGFPSLVMRKPLVP